MPGSKNRMVLEEMSHTSTRKSLDTLKDEGVVLDSPQFTTH